MGKHTNRAQTERSFRHKEISPEHFGELHCQGSGSGASRVV